MTTRGMARDWSGEFEALVGRIAPRFGRREPRTRAAAYLRGLLAPVERKNGWQLAEAAGDGSPDGMQDFLSRMHWDADRVRDDLRVYVVEHLREASAVLILDETGFLKKGTQSAGVHRQYSGTAGRIENCQIGVFLAYAGARGQALIDRALYLPRVWTDDPVRRRRAGIPEAVAFATKPAIGRAMLARAFATEVPCAWVTGDSVYGCDWRLRRLIEAAGKGYVLQVTSSQHLGFRPVAEWLEEVPEGGWTRLSAGAGAKGPRLYDWAWLPHRGAAPGWQKGLLIRAPVGRRDDLAFFLALAPEGTPLAQLARVAGSRWRIEACFETAKGEVGLDHYEVRSWTGWHRHVTLAMLAQAYLAVLQSRAAGGKKPRPTRPRPAAPDPARGQAAPVGARLGPRSRPRPSPRLVRLAPGAPTPGPTMPLDTQKHPS